MSCNLAICGYFGLFGANDDGLMAPRSAVQFLESQALKVSLPPSPLTLHPHPSPPPSPKAVFGQESTPCAGATQLGSGFRDGRILGG